MRAALILAIAFSFSRSAVCGIVAYDFTGMVLFSVNPFKPEAADIAPFVTPVSGRFEYDTTSVAFPATAGAGYRQQRTSGFRATFGTVNVSADDYIVFVGNDIPQTSGPDLDTVAVSFQGNSVPPPGDPLVVNGVPYSSAFFQLNFSGANTVLSSESLPLALNLASFSDTISFLGDTDFDVDVLFSINSLQAVTVIEPMPSGIPEPSSGYLLLSGIAFCLSRRSTRKV